MTSMLLAVLFGILFGFALSKGGLTRYSKIVGVYRLTDLTVIKFMLTAMMTAMIGLYALRGLGVLQFPNPPATYVAGNLIGGLIFGVGMALAGYCPGTVAAGAGEGKLDYLIPGMLGLLTGAVLFGFTYQTVFPPIAAIANLGNVVLPDLWHVDPFLMVAVFCAMTLLLFYLLEHGWQRKDKLKK
jgi:uncharacterized membrane protein YedE/YeeE